MIGHSLGGIEMCFDIASQHLGCWGQNTSRIQHKDVSTPFMDCWGFTSRYNGSSNACDYDQAFVFNANGAFGLESVYQLTP